jgi:hypothetical protein
MLGCSFDMTWDAALKELLNGNAIRLPEWGRNFHLARYGSVFLMSYENGVQAMSHFEPAEAERSRSDWQVASK